MPEDRKQKQRKRKKKTGNPDFIMRQEAYMHFGCRSYADFLPDGVGFPPV